MRTVCRAILIIITIYIVLIQGAGVYAQTIKLSPTVVPSPTAIIPPGNPATGINLTVSPVFINLTTDPGVAVSSQIRIQNNGIEKEYLQLGLKKFDSKNGDTPVIADPTAEDEFIRWVHFSQEQLILDPAEIKTVKFTITPPANAALGYYYSIVISRIKELTTKQAKSSIVSGSPAISVLLDVRSPNAKREMELIDFKSDSLIYEYLPVTFSMTTKNTGNIHIVPSGNIFVDYGNKKDVAILNANDARGNVLPNNQRTFTATWDDGFIVRKPRMKDSILLLDSNGKKTYETTWDYSKADRFRIGKYTAHLLMVYDNGERDVPLEATYSFWVIPWKIILGLAVVVILVLLGIRNAVGSVWNKFKICVSKIRRVILFFLLILPLFLTRTVNATASGITVDPAFVEVTLDKAGQSKQIIITFTNNTSAIVTLDMFPIDFKQLDENGLLGFIGQQTGSYSYSLASFLSFESDKISLDPGQKKAFKITIKNRQDLSPGGHYTAVVAKVEGAADTSENSLVSPSVSSLILLRKAGGERFNMSLNHVDWPDHNIVFSYPEVITLTFLNEGNIHLVPYGDVRIYDMFGRIVSKGIINTSSRRVLPESKRYIYAAMKTMSFTFPISVNKLVITGHDSLNKITYQFHSNFVYINIYAFIALVIGFIMCALFFIKYKRR